eukprot:SAG11_NODE_371_length_10051_cov_5.987741_11_plen_101_part_00
MIECGRVHGSVEAWPGGQQRVVAHRDGATDDGADLGEEVIERCFGLGVVHHDRRDVVKEEDALWWSRHTPGSASEQTASEPGVCVRGGVGGVGKAAGVLQ